MRSQRNFDDDDPEDNTQTCPYCGNVMFNKDGLWICPYCGNVMFNEDRLWICPSYGGNVDPDKNGWDPDYYEPED